MSLRALFYINISRLAVAVISLLLLSEMLIANETDKKSASSLPPTVSLQKSLSSALTLYRQGLRYSRDAAVKKGDNVEFRKVVNALAGRPVANFTNDYTKGLRSALDCKLNNVAKVFIRDATKAVASLSQNKDRKTEAQTLQKKIDKVTAVLAIKSHRVFLEFTLADCLSDGSKTLGLQPELPETKKDVLSAAKKEIYSKRSSDVAIPVAVAFVHEKQPIAQSTENKYYRLIVDATKDWQKYPLTIDTGDRLTLIAGGLWTPDNGKMSPANADKYPYNLKIGDGAILQAGVKHQFIAASGGALLLRIATRETIAEKQTPAAGKLTLTVVIEKMVTQ